MIHNPLLCYESRARQHLNDTILTVFQNPLNIKYDIYIYIYIYILIHNNLFHPQESFGPTSKYVFLFP